MRKYVSNFLLILTAMTFLLSCSEDTADIPSKELLSVPSLVSAEGSTTNITVQVTANCRWTVMLNNGWEGLTLSTKEGSGNGVVQLATSSNAVTHPRVATLTITSNSGVVVREVEVRQEAGDISLSLSRNSVSVVADGISQEITVNSNTRWKVSGGADGFHIDLSEGNGLGHVKLTVDENMYETDREATFTFVAVSETDENVTTSVSLTVHQLGKDVTLDLANTNLLAQAMGGDYQVMVLSNAAWTASADASWISLGRPAGEGQAALNLLVQPNNSTAERTAQVFVRAGSQGQYTTILHMTQQPGTVPVINGATVLTGITKYGVTVQFDYQSSTMPVGEVGVCLATHEYPTLDDVVVQEQVNATAGQATLDVGGLESGTTYYLRPFARNSMGVAYGMQVSFTTAGVAPGQDDPGLPVLVKKK